MTEKAYRKSVERLLVDLHAARSYLNRVERQIRSLIGDDISEGLQDAPGRVLSALDGVNKENTQDTPSNAVEGPSRASGAKSAFYTQCDLFRDTTKLKENNANRVSSRKKGCVTISKAEAMDNFRRFSAGKSLLDLADVNRILGFHKSTSGSFVKLAVRRGDLCSVPVGKEQKFLPIDVRTFINDYFRTQPKGARQ